MADGPVAHQGYAVLWRGMVEEKHQAIAQVVLHASNAPAWKAKASAAQAAVESAEAWQERRLLRAGHSLTPE